MKDAIKEEIRQYRLVSRSKSLRHLQTRNVEAIASQVDLAELKALISKRNQYHQKVLRLLNAVQVQDTEEALFVDEVDPSVITNRFVAEKYVRSLIESSESFKKDICGIIHKHLQFQDRSETKRRAIDPQHQRKFDADLIKQCKKLETESIQVLTKYQVPFFVLQKPYRYPTLNRDKCWMLQKIMQLVPKSV